MEQKSNVFLEKEKLGKLMRMYSIPCIISLLVAALYNIVDQIFIANATYLGSYGNAANNVVFPLTVVALSIAVMIGDGCCAVVSISLGAGEKDRLKKKLENMTGRSVAVTYIEDPSLLGGVIVEIDGRVYDGSLRSRLRQVKEVIDG